MSEYTRMEVGIETLEELVEGLELAGFAREHIEVHESPVSLFGYHGDERPDRAHVIVRRQHVGTASNDLGFVKTDTGYEAVVSRFDRSQYNYDDKIRSLSGFVKMNKAEKKAHAAMLRRGFRLAKRSVEEGKVRLSYVR